MQTWLPVLIGADAVLLHRKLTRQGVDLRRMRLKLNEDANIMKRATVRMLDRGLVHLLPEAVIGHTGHLLVERWIPSPALCRLNGFAQIRYFRRIEEACGVYSNRRIPSRISLGTGEDAIYLSIGIRNVGAEWYRERSLSGMWDALCRLAEELRRCEAEAARIAPADQPAPQPRFTMVV